MMMPILAEQTILQYFINVIDILPMPTTNQTKPAILETRTIVSQHTPNPKIMGLAIVGESGMFSRYHNRSACYMKIF